MDLDLTGKHALVGGGSQGIGRAAAIELARLGAHVTVLARSREALEATIAALPRVHAAQEHAWLAVDMTDSADLRARVEAAATAHPVHILVNNSGGPPAGPAHAAAAPAFLAAFEQHLLANHALLQAVLPGMRGAGYGRVVNVISTSVKEPIRNLGVSNTVRGAVASWAKTLATELAPEGITVNNVLPGFTRTARLDGLIAGKMKSSGASEDAVAAGMKSVVPMGRFADAAEVAAAIAFLASPAASYITGVSIAVDGGRTLCL